MYKKEKGRPHNEHSKYSMPTNCRFYLERALQPMSSVLSEHMSNSTFSKIGEAWLQKNFTFCLPLIKSPLSQTAFSGFQSRNPPFIVKSSFLGFQLDLYFSFSFFIFCFIFLWFKLPFRVFILSLYLSFHILSFPFLFLFLFTFAFQSRPFGFSTLTSQLPCCLKHNTS